MSAETVGKIHVKSLAAAVGLFWGCIVLLVALGNLGFPGYGRAFLETAASMYPGYEAEANALQIILVTFAATVDGAIAGLVVGWLYNRFSGRAAS